MNSVTISKTEYKDLLVRASAYERMLQAAQGVFSLTPPEKSVPKIIAEFKNTGTYSEAFLASLKRGLSRSTHFKE